MQKVVSVYNNSRLSDGLLGTRNWDIAHDENDLENGRTKETWDGFTSTRRSDGGGWNDLHW